MFPLQKTEILNRNPFGGPLTFIMMTMMMMIMMSDDGDDDDDVHPRDKVYLY